MKQAHETQSNFRLQQPVNPSNPSNVSFDPLATVRLPPPTESNAYAWSGSANSLSRPPLRDSTNMLRTPESIMRLNEAGPLKRSTSVTNGGPSAKRSKYSISNYDNESIRATKYTSGDISAMKATNWHNEYLGSLHGHVNNLERPATAHPGSYPRIYHQYAQGSEMLSPSATPIERKNGNADLSLTHTPTRTERPMSVHGDIMGYNRTNSVGNPDSVMLKIPPMPPMPAMTPMPSSLVTRHSLQPAQARYHNPQPFLNGNDIQYDNDDQHEHPEQNGIPSPDQMPEVKDDGLKPTYSYATLIGMAILRAPQRKLTLSQIYAWIMDTFEYYRNSKPTWHNSIRHNLSLNKAFEKKMRPKGDPGKGNYWTIASGLEYQFVKPRAPKRGSDGLINNFTNESNEVSSEMNQTNEPIAPLPISHVTPSTIIGKQPYNILETHQSHENIPSDGTEPDEGMLEEEKRSHNLAFSFSNPQPQSNSYSTGNSAQRKHENDTFVPTHSLRLPQMHAMSSRSSSRPHSPVVAPSSSNGPSNSDISNYSGSSAGVMSKSESSDRTLASTEWRGQGQFAFRCSTPSLIQPITGNLPSSCTDGMQQEEFLQSNTFPPSSGSSNVYRGRSPSKKSVIGMSSPGNPNYETKDMNEATSRNDPYEVNRNVKYLTASVDNKSSTKKVEEERHVPKTPEKAPKATSSSHSIPSAMLNGFHPLLAPPKSLESPYAGTLDLSPGLSLPQDFESVDKAQMHRSASQRHNNKGSNFNTLADFFELDFRKGESGNDHKRSSSNSSEEGGGAADNSQPHFSVPNIVASHVSGLSMAFDVDVSPRLVMTPIRRPFDTPIRDQAQAYSPYCRSASSFGSPLRRG